jgi:hypothetical protein
MSSTMFPHAPNATASPEWSRQPSDRRLIDWTRYVIASLTVGMAFVLLDMSTRPGPRANESKSTCHSQDPHEKLGREMKYREVAILVLEEARGSAKGAGRHTEDPQQDHG